LDSTTFDVSSVRVADKPHPAISQRAHFQRVLKGDLEACSEHAPVLDFPRSTSNALFDAAHLAFSMHYPLVLSPDAIWLTVVQGLATHVALNAEALRNRFVGFEGTKTLLIRDDSLVRGSCAQAWPGLLDQFSELVRDSIGDQNHTRIVADFSTTGPVERTASEIVLMAAMKPYFKYCLQTLCGIPCITLRGNVGDWESIRDRASGFEGLGLDFWLPPLMQVLDGFVAASRGKIDPDWWKSIYKWKEESGGPYIDGWLTWLLPYTDITLPERGPQQARRVRNPLLSGTDRGWALTPDRLPPSLSRVPFEWNYLGKVYDYEFAAGLSGVTQDEKTLAVQPNVGWAARERTGDR
jgi:hypothetical protein